MLRPWLGKTSNKKEASCVICKRNIDLSALHSHASCKKHTECMSEHGKCYFINLFFNKPCSSSTRKTETTKAQCTTWTVKETITTNVTNAEILWCLKVVDRHFSHNTCSDLAHLFQWMFADSKIAQQLLLWKQNADTWY